MHISPFRPFTQYTLYFIHNTGILLTFTFCVLPTFFLVIVKLIGREPFPLPPPPAPASIDTSESYYEEAQPYEETVNGKAVTRLQHTFDLQLPIQKRKLT